MLGVRCSLATWIALLVAPVGFAHDPGLSSAQVVRTGDRVEVQLAFAWADLAGLISGNANPGRPAPAQLAALTPELGQAAGGWVRLEVREDRRPADAVIISPGTASPTEVIVAIRWAQVAPGEVRVGFPVLARMPFGHRMMLTLGNAAEPVALLDARHATWDLPAWSGVMAGATPAPLSTPVHASAFSFVVLGVEHILTGFDHLCFLFALLLVATRFRDVLMVVTTFTVAHSLTLAAAAFGTVKMSSAIVEPLIAASIVYIGLENIFLRRQPRHRLALVFGFGLIHGLGFAGALAERLPGVTGLRVILPLLGFNAGVECGQLAVAACLVPLIHLARKRPEFPTKLQPACSLTIATAGFVWLMQRV